MARFNVSEFKALLAAGDVSAVAVKNVCDAYRLRIGGRSGNVHRLIGVGTALDVARRHHGDASCLEWSLDVLRDLEWLYRYPVATYGVMLEAMAAAYDIGADKGVVESVLCEVEPYRLNQIAAARYHCQTRELCLKTCLLDIAWGGFTRDDMLKILYSEDVVAD